MIDDKKIEEVKESIFNKHFLNKNEDVVCIDHIAEPVYLDYQINKAIELGAKWAINELLKDLLHPASEVPRNDNGKVLAFSKEIGYRKLYDMNDMLDKTTCNTYKEMWKEEVKMYRLSDWIFIDELFDLATKGGSNERA